MRVIILMEQSCGIGPHGPIYFDCPSDLQYAVVDGARSLRANLLLAPLSLCAMPSFYSPGDGFRHVCPSTIRCQYGQPDEYGNVIFPAQEGFCQRTRREGKNESQNSLLNSLKPTWPILHYWENRFNHRIQLYEAIDPVRFIGNHSSGKMGFALAEEGHSLGAKVILISGPTAQSTENSVTGRLKWCRLMICIAVFEHYASSGYCHSRSRCCRF